MNNNQASLNKKTRKKYVTGTIDYKTTIDQYNRLQKTLYRDLNQKKLRTTRLQLQERKKMI